MDDEREGEASPKRGAGGILERHGELILYLVAGVAYITLGVFVKQALALWLEGAAFLLLAVWIVPALIRRIL